MVLETTVNEDGILMIKTPKSLWGKNVKVHVQEKRHTVKPRKPGIKPTSSPLTENHDNQASLAQWKSIQVVLQEIDRLELPQRTIEEILHDLHEFRETL